MNEWMECLMQFALPVLRKSFNKVFTALCCVKNFKLYIGKLEFTINCCSVVSVCLEAQIHPSAL